MIRYDIQADAFARQDLSHLGIADAEIVELTTAFRRIGFWRSDVASGLSYWSEGLFRIFGMECTTGPVNMSAAYERLHPDDLGPLSEVVEQAIAERTAYHFILRIRTRCDEYRFVRSVGKYRDDGEGEGQLVGMCYEFFEQIRTVELAGPPPAR